MGRADYIRVRHVTAVNGCCAGHTVPRTLVVFDMDGTLTDSRLSIYDAYRYAARGAGLPVPSDDVLAHHLCGALPRNVEEIFGLRGGDADLPVRLYREYYARECVGRVPLFGGAEEALRRLRSEGFLLAVATMKLEDIAEEFVRGLGIADLFLTVAGSDRAGVLTKADMIRRCAAEADAEAVIMVGDCRQDLTGAREAGAEFVAAAYGYGLPAEECGAEGIPYVLSPGDIPAEAERIRASHVRRPSPLFY